MRAEYGIRSPKFERGAMQVEHEPVFSHGLFCPIEFAAQKTRLGLRIGDLPGVGLKRAEIPEFSPSPVAHRDAQVAFVIAEVQER